MAKWSRPKSNLKIIFSHFDKNYFWAFQVSPVAIGGNDGRRCKNQFQISVKISKINVKINAKYQISKSQNQIYIFFQIPNIRIQDEQKHISQSDPRRLCKIILLIMNNVTITTHWLLPRYCAAGGFEMQQASPEVAVEIYSPLNIGHLKEIFTAENWKPQRNLHPWTNRHLTEIYTPQRWTTKRNIHPKFGHFNKIFTPEH